LRVSPQTTSEPRNGLAASRLQGRRFDGTRSIAAISSQLGHSGAAFSLDVYAKASKCRERLAGATRAEYDRALNWAEWAPMGTRAESADWTKPAESAKQRGDSPMLEP
jgi:hypothetical protein